MSRHKNRFKTPTAASSNLRDDLALPLPNRLSQALHILSTIAIASIAGLVLAIAPQSARSQAPPPPPASGNCITVVSPSIAIYTPKSAQVFAPGSVVAVTLSVDGAIPTLSSAYSSVTYYGDGVSIGVVKPTVPVNWSPARGAHTIYAAATGQIGVCPISARSPTISFTVANSTPAVTLTVPATATAPAHIALSSAITNTYAISNVSYLVNGTVVGTATVAPYNFTWNGTANGNATGVAAGTYSIQAKATDIYGEVGLSSVHTLTVGSSPAPSVTVTAVPSRSMLPANLVLTANVSDPYTISALSFIVNGTSYPVAAGNAGTFTLPVPLAGSSVASNASYVVSAQATDVWGGSGSSSPVTVNETGHTLPTVSLVSAVATPTVPGEIAVSATASDFDSLTSVGVVVDGNLVSSLTQSPFNFKLEGYTAGTYSVSVLATDSVQLQASTESVDVTIAGAPEKTVTQTTRYEYDPNTGRLIEKMTEPEDSNLCLVQSYAYGDAFGNVTGSTTRNCNGSDIYEAAAPTGTAAFTQRSSAIKFDVSTGTFPTSSTNPLNQSTSATFDPRFGIAATSTDANLLVSQQTPDAFGRVILTIAPDLTQVKTQYLYCSGVYGGTTICPPLAFTAVQTTPYASDGTTQIGPWKIAYYDQLARVIEIDSQGFDGTVVVQSNEFDATGRLKVRSKPYYTNSTPASSTMTYDVLGRVRASTDPENYQTTYTYSALTTSRQDAIGNTTTRTVNSQGEVISVVDALSQTTTFQYDPMGNLSQTTDAAGLTKSWLYDLRGRRVQSIDPDLGTWTFGFNALGELVLQQDAKGNVITLTYDLLSRLLSRTEPDLVSNWEYDVSRSECTTGTGKAVGRLDRAWTNAGNSRIECYDNLARSSQERTLTASKSFVSGWTYDADGRMGSRTYPAGYVYPAGLVTNYSYNAYGYLAGVADASSGSSIWTANVADAAGHITSDSMAGSAITAVRIFDPLDRLTSVQVGVGNTTQNDAYHYDPVGNLQERDWIDNSNAPHSETFTYDALNRLWTVSGPVGKSYTYDDAGNISTKSDVGTYHYIAGTHKISSITGTANGVVNPTFAYDANGNISSEAGLVIAWTSFNMALSLSRGTISDTLVYGPEHQRLEQIATSSSGSATTLYVGADFEQVSNSSTGIVEAHSYISVGGRRLAMFIDRSSVTSTWRYFLQDHIGSVEVVTDQSGSLVERLSYDAWGKRRNMDGTDSTSVIIAKDTRGFTDQEEIDNIGVVNMNGRVYDPTIARFISPDPTISAPLNLQTHNRFSYANNQPLAMVDPSGFTSLTGINGVLRKFVNDSPGAADLHVGAYGKGGAEFFAANGCDCSNWFLPGVSFKPDVGSSFASSPYPDVLSLGAGADPSTNVNAFGMAGLQMPSAGNPVGAVVDDGCDCHQVSLDSLLVASAVAPAIPWGEAAGAGATVGGGGGILEALAAIVGPALATLGLAAIPSSLADDSLDARIPVYRVVDPTELKYLKTFGNYGSAPSESGKYFALTPEGAAGFLGWDQNPAGSTITSTTLPKRVVYQGYQFNDGPAPGAGPSVFFNQAQLPMVYSNMTPPVIGPTNH